MWGKNASNHELCLAATCLTLPRTRTSEAYVEKGLVEEI